MLTAYILISILAMFLILLKTANEHKDDFEVWNSEDSFILIICLVICWIWPFILVLILFYYLIETVKHLVSFNI